MVAELLRLKLFVLANGFRRARGAVLRIVGGLLAVGISLAVGGWLIALAADADWKFRAVVVPLGALVLVTCLLLPVVTARDEPLHARGFVGYGVGPTRLSLALPITDLLSLPALLLAIGLTSFAIAWGQLGSGGAAIAVSVVLLVLGLQLVRLGATLGAYLARYAYGDLVRTITGAVLLAAILAIVIPAVRDPRYAFGALGPMSGWLATTPLGVLSATPGFAEGARWQPVIWGLVAILALWGIWRIVVGVEFSGFSVRRPERHGTRLGWFRIFPATPVGAIAARSLSYWLRDPRYSAAFILAPFVPVLMLVAASIGGIPREWIALVPLPIVVSVLAWSTTHNDIAYDSTAIWAHIVSGIRGVDDRVGRAIPPLLFGLIAIAIGTPLTAWGYGDADIVPAVLGASLAVLLGSIGISSGLSARFPYAAPPPGAGAFAAPQAASGSGAGQQVFAFLGGLLAAAPAGVAFWFWFDQGGAWNWAALGLGVLTGAAILAIGIAAGGRSFERRGPELLAFAMRN